MVTANQHLILVVVIHSSFDCLLGFTLSLFFNDLIYKLSVCWFQTCEKLTELRAVYVAVIDEVIPDVRKHFNSTSQFLMLLVSSLNIMFAVI